MARQMQIGEVAELTGLSLRTIRYYEEVGLVVPGARSQGGFRLYAESDVERLKAVKRMKPLNLQLDEMRELLGLLASVEHETEQGVGIDDEKFRKLGEFSERAEERCRCLRDQLRTAEEFAARLRSLLPRRLIARRRRSP